MIFSAIIPQDLRTVASPTFAGLSLTGDMDMQLTKGIYWPETIDSYGQPNITVTGDVMTITGGYTLTLAAYEEVVFPNLVFFQNTATFSDEIITAFGIFGESINSRFFVDLDVDNTEIVNTGVVASGFIIVRVTHSTTTNISGLFRVDNVAGTTAVTLVSANALFTITKDNAGTYNVYYETDQVKVQNLVGNDRMVRVGLFRAL